MPTDTQPHRALRPSLPVLQACEILLVLLLSTAPSPAPTWTGGTNDIYGTDSYGILDISGGVNTVHGDEGSGFGSASVTVGAGGLNFQQANNPNLILSSDSVAPGILILNGNVTYTNAGAAGVASITNGHRLIDDGFGGSVPSGGYGAIPGRVDLGGGFRTFTINNGTGTNELTIDATITNGGLIKAGAGTLSLAGTNTYLGGTILNEGKLVVSGSAGNSSTTVNGGTLGGTGTLDGLTLQGGTLAPGNGAGTLASGNLLFSGGIFAIELASAILADQVAVTGTAGLGANTALSISLLGGYVPLLGQSWVLVKNDATDPFNTGAFRFTNNGLPIEDNTPFLLGGQNYLLHYNAGTGNDVVLVSAVPEPGTATLLLGGLGVCAAFRRRARRGVAAITTPPEK